VNRSLLVCMVLGVFGVLGGPVGSALAAGDVSEASCPNEAMEGFSANLPDCRAYELVTPPNKEGAQVESTELAAAVAADGSSLAGKSREAFAGLGNDEVKGGTNEFGYYRFSRSASGWVAAPLNPDRGAMMSLGVGDSVWGPAEYASDPARLRLRAADGSVGEIGPVWPPALGSSLEDHPEVATFRVLGGAADARNGIVFSVNEPKLFWPFDSTIGESPQSLTLYEYTGTGNTEPSLVGVSGGAGSTALISQCGTKLGGTAKTGYNAVSEDGSHVFFTALAAGCGGVAPPANELFVRIGRSETVAISEPTATDCPSCNTGAPANAVFQGASADGSKVFFTTTQSLLGSDTSNNLYEYDFAPPAGQPKVVRVSAGDGSVPVVAAEVVGVARISEDGSHVYFVAHGVLTTAANAEGEAAQAGADNMYVFERDAQYPAGHTAFIADLCSEAGLSGSVSDSRCPSDVSPEYSHNDGSLWGDGLAAGDQNRPVQATPDGRFLVFTSYGDLTAGDTSTARQVFQYDARTGSLVRVSIGLEGFNGNGNVTGPDGHRELDALIAEQPYNAGESRGWALARTMSDDGAYVFFQSPVGLTPGALDRVEVTSREGGTMPFYAQNVYEYHAGRVSLIGTDSAPSIPHQRQVLLGTTASGGDVFFQSLDRLVSRDTDSLLDFYDARVDGGFPASVTPAGCEGDGCQGASSGPPVFGSPSSVAFFGAGNVAAPPASRPVVRSRGSSSAQKLSRALAVCRKEPRARRALCRARAEKRFGHSSSAGKSGRGGK
jgi:hypothetical protein